MYLISKSYKLSSEFGVFDNERNKINYYQIQEWLDRCLIETKDPYFKKIIIQYNNLIKRMSTDNEKALAITNMIAEDENYWQSAFLFSNYFKDVKWHTIHRFFTELSVKLN